MRVHFIGIGGVGMSALALACYKKGYQVSGSDHHFNSYTRKLLALGIPIYQSQTQDSLPPDLTCVVYTPVATHTEEYLEAKKKYPCYSRGEFLASFLKDQKIIGVTGSHGKTSTTALLRTLFPEDNAFVGGSLIQDQNHFYETNSSYTILEIDESEPSFLKLHPHILLLTNLEGDHLDFYGSFEKLQSSLEQLKKQSTHFYDEAKLLKKFSYKKTSLSSFLFYEEGKILGEIQLQIFGDHQLKNAFFATCIGRIRHLNFSLIQKRLFSFLGVERRLQLIFSNEKKKIFDDYAHHPTEINTVLKTLQEKFSEPITVLFEPHKQHRLLSLEEDFAKSLTLASRIYVTSIYDPKNEDQTFTSETFCKKYDYQYLDLKLLNYFLQQVEGILLICSAGPLSDLVRKELSTLSFTTLFSSR